MTRSISRIVPLALAITAVAVPAAPAGAVDGFGRPDGAAPPKIDKVSPDARDAARPATAVDSPTRRPLPGPPEWPVDPEPITQASPPVVTADGFDWADAGIGAGGFAALVIVLGGTAATLRTRRGAVRAS